MENLEIKTLKIKKEFKNLIRPLHHQEYLQLEENILRDGCREAIITWNGYIIDGHNRYEICTKHKIPFKVIEMEFEYDEEVITWICMNQLGRRNISDETRKFLIGMQYETEKIINTKKNPGGQNQYTTLDDEDDFVPNRTSMRRESNTSRHKTAERIGEQHHVSSATVQKYANFTRALEIIGTKEPELVPKILSGRYKISHKNIVELSNLSAEELKKVNKRLNRSNNPYFQYSKSRNVINSNLDEKQSSTPSVKDMPTFDPDAAVTELSLTVPTWVSSIKRTQKNANLDIISEKARDNVVEVLKSLQETTEDMLHLLNKEDTDGRL